MAEPADEGLPPLPAGWAAAEGPGQWESFGRGASEGSTLGLDERFGLTDAERNAEARRAHPWTHFAGQLSGAILPTAAAMMLPTGGTQAAGAAEIGTLGARALSLLRGTGALARRALVPGEMNTIGRGLGQGAKVGASWGALSDIAHEHPEDDRSWWQRGITGGLAGGMLGAPLGGMGYLGGRAIGAVLNRLSSNPSIADAIAAVKDPNGQGARDLMRQLGYDNYQPEDFTALQAALRDPANAHRFADLNVVEALEANNPLQERASLARTVAPAVAETVAGEQAPAVPGTLYATPRRSPNTTSWMQDMANTEGAGRHEAIQAFANRQSELPTAIGRNVDEMFGTGADNLENTFERFFGTGHQVADDAALEARRQAFNTRYGRMREQPPILTSELNTAVNQPPFNRALQYAAQMDMMTNPGAGSNWSWLWQNGAGGLMRTNPVELPSGFVLSPSNMLDIHHALVLESKPGINGATPENVLAGRWKQWFSNLLQRSVRGSGKLNQDYALFKRQLEATDLGADLPINTGGPGHPSERFLTQVNGELRDAADKLARNTQAYDAAMERWRNGQISRPASSQYTDLRNQEATVTALQDIRDAFVKAWGGRILEQIGQSYTNAAPILQRVLSPEGQRRTQQVLGERAPEFNRYIMGLLIREELANANTPANVNAIVRKYLSPAGQSRIMQILGPEDGRRFIEMLFNKQTQGGLSNRLFNNSDTAYKLERGAERGAFGHLSNALSAGLNPFNWRPMEALDALHSLAAQRFTRMRADQANAMLARQGPAEIDPVLSAIIGNQTLANNGPRTARPLLAPAIGATASALPQAWRSQTQDQYYRPPPGAPPI